MFLECIVLSVFCLLVYLQLKWSRVKRFWAIRHVPHLPPHPILGSLTFFMKQNSSAWIRQLYEHFRAPYIGIWAFWRPALVVTSPELARRILVTDSDNFRDRFVGTGVTDPIEAQSLFMVKDPLWSSIRRRLNGVFTSAKLKSVQDVMRLKSRQLVQRIRRELENDKTIDLRSLYSDYSTDVISIAAFGVNGDATLTGTSPMRDVTKSFMKYNFWRGISWFIIFFLPPLANIFKFRLFPKETTNYLRIIFNTAVAQRGGYGKEVNQVRDLVDALMKMKQDAAKEGEEMSEELLVSQATIFLQGGFDTSAVALAFATYELAFAPEVQNKLYLELAKGEESVDAEELGNDALSSVTYLDCVIKETLRKYSGWLDRVAAKSYAIDENLTIPAGTPVLINITGMHYDPELFEDPVEFRPERFSSENAIKIKPYSYMPFGEGPKHCIGLRFGQQTMRYGLASVISNFEVRPKPKFPKPSECELEKRGLFVGPGMTLTVDFVPRTSNV